MGIFEKHIYKSIHSKCYGFIWKGSRHGETGSGSSIALSIFRGPLQEAAFTLTDILISFSHTLSLFSDDLPRKRIPCILKS